MILDGVCHPVTHFRRAILYVYVAHQYSVFSDVYLGWCIRLLCLPRCYATNIRCLYHLSETLSPSLRRECFNTLLIVHSCVNTLSPEGTAESLEEMI